MRVAFLLGLLLVVAAPLAHAQGNSTATNSTNATAPTNATGNVTNATPAGPVEFTLEGHQDGADLYWTLAGQTEKNPTLTVQPGQQVVFHVKSASGLHNFKVADLKATAPFSDTDPAVDVTWTAPTTPGSVVYICTIHGAVMSGKIVVGSAGAPSGGGGGAGAISGDSVDLADVKDAKTGKVLYPQCAGKGVKVPAIVQNHVTGGPTLDDYAKLCAATVAADPYKSVDYVIPISLALVGVGIVGIVWVHRAYKP